LVASVESDLVEDLVLAKVSIVGNVVQDHKDRAGIVAFSAWVGRDDFLFDVVYGVDLIGVVRGVDEADGDVLGELFNDVLRGRLDKARVEAVAVVVHDVFDQDGLALAGSAENVPGKAEGHVGKVIGAQRNVLVHSAPNGPFEDAGLLGLAGLLSRVSREHFDKGGQNNWGCVCKTTMGKTTTRRRKDDEKTTMQDDKARR
jgi:hypothetical protein